MSIAPPTSPTNPWITHAAEITEVVPEITGVATYHLRLTDAAARNTYACEPGRFNMLYLPGVGEAAISVSGHDAIADTCCTPCEPQVESHRHWPDWGRGESWRYAGRLAQLGPQNNLLVVTWSLWLEESVWHR